MSSRPDGPYSRWLVPVLTSRYVDLTIKALAGELLTADSRLTSHLAGSKRWLNRATWCDFAEELARCRALYRSAWQRFEALGWQVQREIEPRRRLAGEWEPTVVRLQELIARFPAPPENDVVTDYRDDDD